MSIREIVALTTAEITSGPASDKSASIIQRAEELSAKWAGELTSISNPKVQEALTTIARPILGCAALFKSFEAASKTRYGTKIPQRLSYTMVDHWTKLESIKALYIEIAETAGASSKGIAPGMEARIEALVRELSELSFSLVKQIGLEAGFGQWAPALDWIAQELKSPKIGSFDGSIAQLLHSGM